ncbi:MAG: hypothetical protein ACI9MR_002541 [Myxococcota bacterium]|jgi:hypothetical protein
MLPVDVQDHTDTSAGTEDVTDTTSDTGGANDTWTAGGTVDPDSSVEPDPTTETDTGQTSCSGDADCANGACDTASGTCSNVDLCHPCGASTECDDSATEAGVCAVFPDGSDAFCGVGCEDDDGCPTGFECAFVDVLDQDDSVEQCVPTDGVCDCPAEAIANGASTACGFGACAGQRTCSDAGLSACDGPAPSVEVCDGSDNSCSGVPDDPFIIGGAYQHPEHCGGCGMSCKTTFSGAEVSCVGGTNGPECQFDGCAPGFVESSPGNCIAANDLAACVPCASDDNCLAGLSCKALGTASLCVAGCGAGGACDDGFACETVDGQALCVLEEGGCSVEGLSCITAAVCEDRDPCTDNACDRGQCGFTALAEAASCEDGDPCTSGETSSAGVCGQPVGDSDDGNDCTTDSCGADGCVHTPGNGQGCDDGEICTDQDVCTGTACGGTSGACECQSNTDCTTVPAGMDALCVTLTCNAGTGQCEVATSGDGNICDDQDTCTETDVCAGGVCGGTILDCSSLNNACAQGVCVDGMCEEAAVSCPPTAFVLQTPSAAMSVPAQSDAYGTALSIGHGSPAGDA